MKQLTYTHSFSGFPLRKPLVLQIKERETLFEKELRQYILETFLGKQSKLAAFTLENESTTALVKYLYVYGSRSHWSLYNDVCWVYKFCQFLKTSPDQILKECIDKKEYGKPAAIANVRQHLEDYIAYLSVKGVAPSTKCRVCNTIVRFFGINDIKLHIPYRMHVHTAYEYRAPTLEEILKVLTVASIRDKFVIAALASGGFRSGTLSKLKYRHVKNDLESGTVPVHVHVEAAITKGKLRDYSTFLCQDAVDYLKAYLDSRKKGVGLYRPEEIIDESPLIRGRGRTTKPLSTDSLENLVRELFYKTKIIPKGVIGRPNELKAHSFRKFFQTELASGGVHPDFIDYMMGHRGNKYSDVKSKGIEYLRDIYISAGLSLQPKTKESRVAALVGVIRRWGFEPKEVLKPEFIRFH